MASTGEQKKAQREIRNRINKVWQEHGDAPDMFKLAVALYKVFGGTEQIAIELHNQYRSSPENSLFREKVLRQVMQSWTMATPKESDTSRLKRLSDAEVDNEINRLAKIIANKGIVPEDVPDPEYVI